MSAIDGVVFFAQGDTVSQSAAGALQIEVKNLHDEFLSGQENIQIELTMWEKNRPGVIYSLSANRNSLVNSFDHQGNTFLLDGDIISLAPDSSAKFLVGWDHAAYRLFENASPRFQILQCPDYPLCEALIVTDSIYLKAKGTIRLFEQETISKELNEVEFTIFYLFDEGLAPVRIFDIESVVDSSSNEVRLSWTTFFHYGVDFYEVQRSIGTTNDFRHLQFVDIDPNGLPSDTISYGFVDREPVAGISSYRLGMWETPHLFTMPIVAYYLQFPIVFVPR